MTTRPTHPFINDSTPAERIRDHKDTLQSRAIAEANEPRGRFGQVEKTVVNATEPIVRYPAAAPGSDHEWPLSCC